MAVIIDMVENGYTLRPSPKNDGIKFLEEFRAICSKYVKCSSILQMTFKDGSTIGMRTLLEVGLGVKQIEDII